MGQLNTSIKNELVLLDSKTEAPLYIHFGSGKKCKGIISSSKTIVSDGIYAEGYITEWDLSDIDGATVNIAKNGYLFKTLPTSEKDLKRIIIFIDNLFKK